MQTNANTSVESHDVETWSAWASRANNAYIGFLTLTLVATVLIVVFNSRLNKAKDAAYGREKQASDERIAAANAGAAEATRKAAEANEGLAKSGEKIAALTKEAEQAKTERAEADKQIAIAKADALRAKEGIANAEARSVEASAEVARLQVVVANAEKRRLEAEKALLELQERIEPRHLTAEQRGNLVRLLKARDASEIEVVALVGDSEAKAFAVELKAALDEAGWKTGSAVIEVVFVAPYPVIGLFLSIRDEQTAAPPPSLEVLYRAMERAGLAVEAITDTSQASGTLKLLVGHKP